MHESGRDCFFSPEVCIFDKGFEIYIFRSLSSMYLMTCNMENTIPESLVGKPYNYVELQIRRSIRDNSKIIFLISQRKHIL